LRPEPPRKPDLRAAGAAERLGAIVEAAERAAQAVIDDAEAEARRYLAEAKADADRRAGERDAELGRLVDSLLADALAVRESAERMVESLRRAQQGLGEAPAERRAEPTDESREDDGMPRLAAVEELRPRQPEPSTADGHGTAGARLLATQLAVSGSSREEIDRRLRNGFEIADTTAILDAILGPEGED